MSSVELRLATVNDSTEITIIATWVFALKETIEAAGADSKAVFLKAGIDLDSLGNPNARVSSHKVDLAFQYAEAATNNPAIGLSLAEIAHPSSWHALGYSLFASSTLHTFFQRLNRFFRMLSLAADLEIIETDEGFVVSADPHYDTINPSRSDAFAAIIVKFCRLVYRSEFSPVSMALLRPTPLAGNELEDYFKCPITCGNDRMELLISKKDMNAALPAANSELARRNDEIVIEYLARFDKERLVPRVQAEIISSLPSGNTTKDIIAQTLKMSTRTLQRRLELEGTSFHTLLNDTRKDLAIRYLKESHRSIKEITYLLGFTDSSNFSRAFKRWTGQPPRAIRDEDYSN